MRTKVQWTDRVPEREGIKSCVYDLAFSPDGRQLVAAVGSRVLKGISNDVITNKTDCSNPRFLQ